MWTNRRNRWVLGQSLVWLPLLVTCASAPFVQLLSTLRDGPWRLWWSAGLLGLGFLSYARLTWVLRAGRRAADFVTIGRFCLILVGMAGLFVFRVERIELWFCLVFGVSLDLVDGWVARRTGPTQEGAVLDMETDQLTTLFLALLAHDGSVRSGSESWIALAAAAFLVLPALKYAFAIALRNVPEANDPKPGGDNSRGRFICAVVLVGLLVATAPFFGESSLVRHLRLGLGVFLALLLSTSFSADLRKLGGRSATDASSARPS